MKYLIIILVFLNIIIVPGFGQDLEQVKPVKAKERLSINKTEDLRDLSEGVMNNEKDIANSGNKVMTEVINMKSEEQVLTDTRDPNTYRKEEYLNQLLRSSYYQRLQTPAWAKYLNPGAWKTNMLKWRYWGQLKNYVSSNDEDIIVLRSNIQPKRKPDIHPDSTLTKADSTSEMTLPVPEEPKPLESDIILAEQTSNEINQPFIPDAGPNHEKEKIKEVIATKKAKDSKKLIEPSSEEVITARPGISEKSSITKEVKTQIPANTSPKVKVPPPVTRVAKSNLAFVERKGNLSWPVSRGRVSERFGIRKNAEARGLRPENYGIDMICPPGEIVKAIHAGTVLLAKRQSPYDFIVTIKHDHFTTAYYYLITPFVQAGDRLEEGQAIGRLRTSVAEADFHFEIWNDQERVNPEIWLKKR